MSIINNPVTFDGIDINTINGLTVLATDPYKLPRRNVVISDIARTNKAKVNSAFYSERIILVRVSISRATRALMEQSIDALMALLQGKEKVLVLNQGGTSRKYYCTLSDGPVDNDGGSYIEIELNFLCNDRFGYDNFSTLLTTLTAFTSGQKTTQLTFGGSAPTQVPVITITFTSITTGTNKNVLIGNDANGQQLTINRTWANGDILEIDSFNRTVKVNGTDVAFTGAIPEWLVGTGYLSYSDTFAARTLNMNATYFKRYV